ncbi:molybdopterin biosynthesis protein [Syntrophorhabdus aromaticivorans]|uniref:Molybdopterin molybdenumtransferase n=1 Tax=Syntrophorhabdus aromaticivorans TaxID=328301 RepID=A0A971RZJ2_9BACT|nr:molybdopterin biosynthesis protein [Syntrophorhabdus aromaticivorans]NLW34325.1 molybdopterin biosynthesis protein [Syntrophorhabdus aromaticivorans]
MAKRYLETIKSKEALRRILDQVGTIGDEEYLPTHLCKNRVTTRPVFAKYSNPPFVCSAMDGYATSFAKTLEADLMNPLALDLNNDAFAVNTGDPLPKGTDSVIMVEEVERADEKIIIRKPAYLWQHVRMIGEDIVEGDMLLPANQKIRTLDVGMLLSAGITHVYVRRKPTIFIIPTGKELVDIYKEPVQGTEPRGLIDFNSYLLANVAEEMGFNSYRSQIAINKDELSSILNDASLKYDVIIVNAGSSAGSEDFTEAVISELGRVIFHGVSMMPGKPTIFGMVHGKPVFGIPGYPVSAVTSFKKFIEPLCEHLTMAPLAREHVSCIMPYKVPSRIGIEEILRVNLMEKGGKFYAFPLPRGASIFSSLARADGLITIPENIEGYEEDEEITCELLRGKDDIGNSTHIIGSHDLSLEILRDMMKRKFPDRDLISTHVGSLSGIMAFQRGVTDLCTTHVLDEHEKMYNIPVVKKYVPNRPWLLVHIAKRTQGLLVREGNPKLITGISDMVRDDVTFVNRQVGSGTRILFDLLLKEKGIDRGSIRGYDREESSHTAVAVLVREAVADTGIAINAVARIFSLGFIPLAEEDYDLLVTKEFAETERFKRLLDLIRSEEFKDRLKEVGGYNTGDTGKIKYVNG